MPGLAHLKIYRDCHIKDFFQPNDIKEGADVYFECNAHANPPITKLEWMHNVRLTHGALFSTSR